MNQNFLDFEQPIAELEAKIEELRRVGTDTEINISDEITRLQSKSMELTESVFSSLTAWQITQLARHPQRPHFLNYIDLMFTDFDELHGDRHYSDPCDYGNFPETDPRRTDSRYGQIRQDRWQKYHFLNWAKPLVLLSRWTSSTLKSTMASFSCFWVPPAAVNRRHCG